jgi:signal transduction histidine kinase
MNKGSGIFYAKLLSTAIEEEEEEEEEEEVLRTAVIDITASKKDEAELKKYRQHLEELVNERTSALSKANEELDRKMKESVIIGEQLRELTVHIQTVREEERIHVAREIHDELGQTLTVLKMDLYRIEKKLPEGKIRGEMKDAIKFVGETIESVRKIISSLRPDVLDHLGLTAAIHWHIRGFCKRSGIHCTVEADPAEITLDDAVSTVLYRILQEALTNAARHAEATEVSVRLKAEGGWIQLEVRDNGKGIGEADISGAKSFGLMGMRERAHSLGGEVTFKSVRGRGTTVAVKVPLKGGDHV